MTEGDLCCCQVAGAGIGCAWIVLVDLMIRPYAHALTYDCVLVGLALFLAAIAGHAVAFAWGQQTLEAAGVSAEQVEAIRVGAEEGDAEAQFLLGGMYGNGIGVVQDDAEAVRWYRLAAEQGHTDGQFYLGVRYETGIGVAQDYVEAVRWYRLAAEHGDARGQLGLGVMYADGRGVPQDYVTAHMWLNLAGAQGEEGAREARDLLAEYMTQAQLADAQRRAREWTLAKRTTTP